MYSIEQGQREKILGEASSTVNLASFSQMNIGSLIKSLSAPVRDISLNLQEKIQVQVKKIQIIKGDVLNRRPPVYIFLVPKKLYSQFAIPATGRLVYGAKTYTIV